MPDTLPQSVLAAAASAFGANEQGCVPVRGGNFSHVFAFSRAGQKFILRLTPPGDEIDAPTLRAGLDFMSHLAQGGVSVPRPLRSHGGDWIVACESPHGDYLAAAFERAPGVLAEELPFSAWDPARFTCLGQAVGRFHARASTYTPPPGLERPAWDQAGNCFHPAEELPEEPLRLRRQEIWRQVQALPRGDPGPEATQPGLRGGSFWGWIHADLHGGNFMLEPQTNRITLLDFDDYVRGWTVMDIAMLLHDFCVLSPAAEKDGFAAHFLHHFLRGYLPAFPLDPFWIESLPLFLKLLETGIYAQVSGFAASVEPNSWVGRFMHGRKERIAAGIPVVSLDFAHIYREALSSGSLKETPIP